MRRIEFLEREDHASEEMLIKLSYMFKQRHYENGQVVFEPGEKSDRLFIVAEGVVKI